MANIPINQTPLQSNMLSYQQTHIMYYYLATVLMILIVANLK
jgi:hypothetical protein